jgi:phage regulator Rha-like protein
MTSRDTTQQTKDIQAITFSNADKLTMSSREISELTGKRHHNVMRDIVKMLNELDLDVIKFEGIYSDTLGRQQTEYNLDQELTITLISGYNAKLRHAIVKRWVELEKQASAVKATRLDGKQVRKIETDAISNLVEYAQSQGSKSANMYYTNITKMTNSILGIESGQRDNLTEKQLSQVKIAETIVKMAIDDGLDQSLPYKEVYKLCKDRVSSIAKVLLN